MGCSWSHQPPIHPAANAGTEPIKGPGGFQVLPRVGQGSSLATTALLEAGLRLPPPPTVALTGNRSFESPKRVACRHGCGFSVPLAAARDGALVEHEGSCEHGAALSIVSCPVCRIRGISGAKHHVRQPVKKRTCGCGADEVPPETACELARVRGSARRYIALQETKVQCRQCGKGGIRDREFHKHLRDECPNRMTACKLCGESVLQRHESFHSGICPQRNVDCVYACGQVLLACHRTIHETMLCPNRPVPCPLFCGAMVPADDTQEHVVCLCPMRLSVWHTKGLVREGLESATATILREREIELRKYPWKQAHREFFAVEQRCHGIMRALGYDPAFAYRRKVALHEIWRRFTQDHRVDNDVSLSGSGVYREPKMAHNAANLMFGEELEPRRHDEATNDDPALKTLDVSSPQLCIGVPEFYLGPCSGPTALHASDFIQYVAKHCCKEGGTIQHPPTGIVTLKGYLGHFSRLFGDRPDEAQALLSDFGWCGDFRTLAVSGKGFGAVAMAHVGRFVGSTAANETLTGLDASDNELCGFRASLVDDEGRGELRWGIGVFVRGLALNESLCSIELSGNTLGWDGGEKHAMPDARKLSRNGGRLQHINGAVPPARYQTLAALLGALECHPSLDRLFLSNNGLGPAAVPHLNHLLLHCRKCGTIDRCNGPTCGRLAHLGLSGNPLGDAGVTALVRGLALATYTKYNVHDPFATLHSLDLKACGIHPPGIEALSMALRRPSCALTALNLARNQLGWQGAHHLADALRINKGLTSLNLHRADLGLKRDPCGATVSRDSSGAVVLLGSLGYTGTMAALDLSENSLDETVAQALSHMFARTGDVEASLTALDVSGNPLGVHGLAALLGSIAKDGSLCSLDVSRTTSNKRSLRVSEQLGHVLRKNHALTSLRAAELVADIETASLAKCLGASLLKGSPNAGVLAKLDLSGVVLDLTAANVHVSPVTPEDTPETSAASDSEDMIAVATAAVAAAVQSLLKGSALLSSVADTKAKDDETSTSLQDAVENGALVAADGPTAATPTALAKQVTQEPLPPKLPVLAGLGGRTPSASSLTTLVLSGQCLLAADGVLLGNLLAAGCNPLEMLDVSKNHIGQSLDVGLSSAGVGHATGATIRASRSTSIGFVALARGIEASRSLIYANLSHNYVAFDDEVRSGRQDGSYTACDGMKVANALGIALERTTSLQVLELENVVGLPMQAATAFADALIVNKTLHTFNLAGNRLGLDPNLHHKEARYRSELASLEDETDELLGTRKRRGVKHMGLSALSHAVATHNSTLVHLDLRRNWLAKAEVDAFRQIAYRGPAARMPCEMTMKLRLPLLVAWGRFFLLNKFHRDRRHLVTADQEHALLSRIFEFAGSPRSILLGLQKEKRAVNCTCGARCRVNPTSKVV